MISRVLFGNPKTLGNSLSCRNPLETSTAIMKSTLPTVIAIITLLCLTQCGPAPIKEQERENSESPKMPDEVLQAILKEFPGALPYRAAMDTVLYRMRLA